MRSDPFKKYKKEYSEKNLWEKLKKYARVAGQKTVYSALLMFYAFRRKETPGWAKNVILGAIGYFLSPFDGVPDLTPFLGYTDDLGVLSFGLVTIASYIDADVKKNARERLEKWFGDVNESELKEIDDQL